MRRFTPLILALLLFSATGCGDDTPDHPANRDAPGVTVGGVAYENGGADGSGADGTTDSNARGGIGAGPDTPPPAGQDGGDIQ